MLQIHFRKVYIKMILIKSINKVAKLKSSKILGNARKSEKTLRKSQKILENHRKFQEMLEDPSKFEKSQ